MAIGRLSMKVGKAGKAGPHAAYIAREGQYAERLERGEKLEATAAGNMPAWAQSNPLAFWQAADAFERTNGTTYREMEIALPRELSAAQRAALVHDFVRQEIGDRHAYQWAIHTPTAADGQEQPHVHLMLSERQRDGIERDPEQYFKRYNAKTPEKGGARKGYGPSAGQTLTKAERATELKALRGRWQTLCNAHLEHAGLTQRIDMRSHAERGTGQEPERKQLPSQWRGQGKANVIEFRQARAAHADASQALANAIPDPRAEILNQQEARRRAEQEKAQQQDHQRLERMTSSQLAQEIARLRPPPLHDLVARDPTVIQAHQEHQTLEQQRQQAQRKESQAKHAAEQWREAHPLRAKAHDAGLFRSPVLDEQAGIAAQTRQQWLTMAPRIQDAELRLSAAREAARLRINAEQAPALAKVDELETLCREKVRQESEQRTRLQAEQQALRALESVPKDFANMALKRELRAGGWSDRGSQWAAVPAQLKTLIEGYNAVPKEGRQIVLDRIMSDGERRKQVCELMAEQRAQHRENDRGLSR